jgi:hypothetical protein
MRLVPDRPRLVVLAAFLAASVLAACGNVTGPSEPAQKTSKAAPRISTLDGGTNDTTANRPVIPWY